MLRTLILLTLFMISNAANAAPLTVVTSFTILADMVHEVGADLVDVKSIVGPDGDAHAYEPTPADAKALSQAQVVFINGLGLDQWIAQLATASGFKGALVVATAGVKTHVFEEGGKPVVDPHAWQDLSNGIIYVTNIAKALCDADSKNCSTYQTNAANYQSKLAALDADIKKKFKSLPPTRRQVVTTHDAFGYFASAYDLRFLAPEGFATESEPSAASLSKLISQIKHDNIKAVFFENMSDRRVIDAIAAETGIKPGPPLYADALSRPGQVADSYITMFQYNAEILYQAMAGN